MAEPVATGIYDWYGRFYGFAEFLFRRRLSRALAAVRFAEGDRMLDVGVGTGLSLEFVPAHVHVTGVDLSRGMLHAAQQKLAAGTIRRASGRASTALLQADALALPFADDSFNVVMLSHMISTVPDPVRCLKEALRVARDQATIVLVNHFRNPFPAINWIETAIDPLCRRLGWRSDLSLEELLGAVGVTPCEGARQSRGFIFRIVYLQKRREAVHVISPPAPANRKAVFGVGRA